MAKTYQERFWDKVNKTDACWLWTGCKITTRSSVRGQAWVSGKLWLAHRLSWFMAYGPIPQGLEVCHECDNPLCVRPDHLFLGTHKDNMQDCVRKGRLIWQARPEMCPRGEGHPRAKLTVGDIREIRKLWRAGGLRQKDIAVMFGVHQKQIWSIVNGKTWRHVDD